MGFTFAVFVDSFVLFTPIHVHVVVEMDHTVGFLDGLEIVEVEFLVVELGFGAGDLTGIFEEGISILVHTALGPRCETYINDGVFL